MTLSALPSYCITSVCAPQNVHKACFRPNRTFYNISTDCFSLGPSCQIMKKYFFWQPHCVQKRCMARPTAGFIQLLSMSLSAPRCTRASLSSRVELPSTWLFRWALRHFWVFFFINVRFNSIFFCIPLFKFHIKLVQYLYSISRRRGYFLLE